MKCVIDWEQKLACFFHQFHAITGCDTTSYFFRVAKKTPFKKAVECEKLHFLSELGHGESLSKEYLIIKKL